MRGFRKRTRNSSRPQDQPWTGGWYVEGDSFVVEWRGVAQAGAGVTAAVAIARRRRSGATRVTCRGADRFRRLAARRLGAPRAAALRGARRPPLFVETSALARRAARARRRRVAAVGAGSALLTEFGQNKTIEHLLTSFYHFSTKIRDGEVLRSWVSAFLHK